MKNLYEEAGYIGVKLTLSNLIISDAIKINSDNIKDTQICKF